MAQSLSRILVHLVFSTKNREPFIAAEHRERLFAYLGGTLNNIDCPVVAVGGVADRPVARDLPLLDGAALDDALNDFAWSLDVRDEPQASAALRRQLVRRLGRRAADQALTTRRPA